MPLKLTIPAPRSTIRYPHFDGSCDALAAEGLDAGALNMVWLREWMELDARSLVNEARVYPIDQHFVHALFQGCMRRWTGE